MHAKAFVVGTLAATFVTAQEVAQPVELFPRAEAASPTATTRKFIPWQTQDPSKVASYHSEMHSLHTKIRADPMFTSMKAALKTAIPQTYKEAMMTNPVSLRRQYKNTPPPWYSALPGDVRSFMEGNQKAAKSIYEKDMGPAPTSGPKGGASKSEDKDKDKKKGENKDAKKENSKENKDKDKKKSDANSLNAVGATAFTLVGAFAVAALLL